MRIVADTNVLISALMFAGLPGAFLQLGLERQFTLVTSKALLDELAEKLVAKFGMSEPDARAVQSRLESAGDLIEPKFTLHVVKDDPDDNRVLECAVAGKADFVVSGDRHLLRVGEYDGIPIMTVRQFLERTGLITK